VPIVVMLVVIVMVLVMRFAVVFTSTAFLPVA
jgi:hypothetical protein